MIKLIQKHDNSDAKIIVVTSHDLSLPELHQVWEQFLVACGYDKKLINDFYSDEKYGCLR